MRPRCAPRTNGPDHGGYERFPTEKPSRAPRPRDHGQDSRARPRFEAFPRQQSCRLDPGCESPWIDLSSEKGSRTADRVVRHVPRRKAPGLRPSVPTRVREQWGKTYRATSYRELPWFSPRLYPWLKLGIEQRWIRPRTRILDVGCGAGTNSLFLARAGFRVSGIDLAPGAIEAARRRSAHLGLSVDFRVGDALRLPFSDRTFGGIVDVGCYHTIPVRLRAAYSRELGRVLRPGGRYLVSWVGRESTGSFGPPHRPSLEETAAAFEGEFLFLRTEFEPPRRGPFSSYHAVLERRSLPQPPRR